MTEIDLAPAMLRGSHMERLMPSLGQRERATLGGLVVAGKIGSAELVAANRWLMDYLLAEHGVFQSDGPRGNGMSVSMFAAEARCHAATSHRAARQAIGENAHALLVAVVCDGQSLRDWAWTAGVSRGVPQRRMVAALGALVGHYTATDAARKKVA